MPTGVYIRHPIRSKWKHGQELIDLTEAGKILYLSISGVHWQTKKKGALKLHEFSSGRWWVLKSDVLELAANREKEAEESIKASNERQLKRQKEWHTKMTTESRCHWCGAPALKEFKNACEKHIEAQRSINRRSKERIKAKSSAKGLCAMCNRQPKRFGFETCSVCSRKGALANRNRRLVRTLKKFDNLIDRGLIDINEAAQILETHRVRVHQFINMGRLQVKAYIFGRFYLSEADVRGLKKDRILSKVSV